jgi:hypothetical protein
MKAPAICRQARAAKLSARASILTIPVTTEPGASP